VSYSNCNIGILGGTFDPAHYGHVEISTHAYKSMGLDQIWWLVTSKNPIKGQSLNSFADRVAESKNITKNIPYIKIYENNLNLKTNYTSELVKKLTNKYSRTNFVWIMGADNLVTFHKWHKFDDILNNIPIAVIDRNSYRKDALKSQTAVKYSSSFINNSDAKILPLLKPPAWTYLDIKTLDISSTKIRESSSSN